MDEDVTTNVCKPPLSRREALTAAIATGICGLALGCRRRAPVNPSLTAGWLGDRYFVGLQIESASRASDASNHIALHDATLARLRVAASRAELAHGIDWEVRSNLEGLQKIVPLLQGSTSTSIESEVIIGLVRVRPHGTEPWSEYELVCVVNGLRLKVIPIESP